MTVGLLKARAPFGAVMSFVVASPILNPIGLALVQKGMGVGAVVALIIGGLVWRFRK